MSSLSHGSTGNSFVKSLKEIQERVKKRGDLPHVSMKRQLELLDEIIQFDLGRFLVEHRGLNGFWTHYLFVHPKNFSCPIEEFLLTRCPIVKATQERFAIFQKEIQRRLSDEMTLASIPCGVMGDLLLLDYSDLKNVQLVGIDIDPESIEYAKKLAEEKFLSSNVHFEQKDAWNLQEKEKYDLITSNGLNIYEPNADRLIVLYRGFYEALKEKGVLVTSFIIPPPGFSHRNEWNMDEISLEDALLQKILFVDLLKARWQAFQTKEQVEKQLREAGFKRVEFIFDKARMFPTVIAYRTES